MNVKSSFFLLAVVSIAATTIAQENNSILFWNNYSAYNPANSGVDFKQLYAVQANGYGTDLETSPLSLWLLGDVRLKRTHGALGVNYIGQQYYGYKKSQKLTLNYSFNYNITENNKLYVGISLGAQKVNYDEDFNNYWMRHPSEYPIGKSLKADIGFGLVYKFKKLKLGASVTNLTESKYVFQSDYEHPTYRSYYLFGSYQFNVSKNFSLNPQVFYQQFEEHFKSVLYDHLTSGNLRIIYKDMVWIGAAMQGENTYGIIAGGTLAKKFNLAFSMTGYQLLKNFNYSKYEISLSFALLPKSE